MLLVHDDQADPRQRREDRGAGAHDDAHVAGGGGVAHRPALAVGEPGVQHGDLIAEARGEAARGLRRERDLGHQHEHRAAARERALGGAQVHLGLARARDAVEQEVASARREQRLDLPDRGRLGLVSVSGRGVRPAVTRGTRRRASSVTRPSFARRRTVAGVVPPRSTSSASGSGPAARNSSSARRRAVVAGTPVAATHVSLGARTRGGSASASARAGVEP